MMSKDFMSVNALCQALTVTMSRVCAILKTRYFPQSVTNNEIKHNFHKLA